jgi:cytidine deaminase
MLRQEQRNELVTEARAAAARAFLTSVGGTAYGAAVLTASGNIYKAGQYSSFNHVTNVHAEHVALVLATMGDDPDVLALAVASTGAEPITRNYAAPARSALPAPARACLQVPRWKAPPRRANAAE